MFQKTLRTLVNTRISLVWITDKSINGMENPAHRKLNEISALNLQTGNVMNFHPRQKVYQKT